MRFIDWIQTLEEPEIGRDLILLIAKIKRDNYNIRDIDECIWFYSHDWKASTLKKLEKLVSFYSKCQECNEPIELGDNFCPRHQCRSPDCRECVNKTTSGNYNYYCANHLKCGSIVRSPDDVCNGCLNSTISNRVQRSYSI